VFHEGYPEHSKAFRVIKGIHGLHVYATEYWVEYLLSKASGHGGIMMDPCIAGLANELANKLEFWAPSNVPLNDSDPCLSDERLLLLGEHKILQNHVKRSLSSGTIKQLERELQREHSKFKSVQRRLWRL
jgi:hypothetical protein